MQTAGAALLSARITQAPSSLENDIALNLLRAGLIVSVSGIGLFVASMAVGLLTIVPVPPEVVMRSGSSGTPITPQVGKSLPIFGVLGKVGIGVFIAGVLVSVVGAVVRKRG